MAEHGMTANRETSDTAEPPQPTLLQDLGALLRYGLHAARARLGGRRALILLAIAAVGGGIAFGWNWLVAIGVAPILLALAPCAAMCAAGVCMARTGGKSCSSQGVESADLRATSVDTRSASGPIASAAGSVRVAADSDSPELPFEPVDDGARLAPESLRPSTSKERI